MTIAGDQSISPEPDNIPPHPAPRAAPADSATDAAIPVLNPNRDADLQKAPESPLSHYSQPQPRCQYNCRESCTRSTLSIILLAIALTTAVVTLGILLPRRIDPPPPPSTTVNYATGVSLISSYAVETTVQSRLARSNLTMEVLNGMNCSSVHVVTLQLPLNTRVVSLKTKSDQCTTHGKVMEIKEAREEFVDQTSNGLAAAYVEVGDDYTYTIQVGIPPFGSTNVELVVEQLLQTKRGEVGFDIPLIPNEEVDSLVFDLSVVDVDGTPVGFEVELNLPEVSNVVNATGNGTKFHLDLHDARQHDLPHVLHGKYIPRQVPEDGLLYFDGTCFEHYFLPPSLKPMPRNFIFLLDVSDDSRHYKTKFKKTREALSNFIDTLDDQDVFSIQTFAHEGTMDVWGPNPGSDDEKADAKSYLDSLTPGEDEYWNNWGTNLHAAILEGLIRAKDDIKGKNDTVLILVVVSDGWASRGETDRAKIVNDVYGYNKDGAVKIFTMGYQYNADVTLLDAISLMNGGISTTIREGGDGDFSTQMTRFLESELGSVLLSDMNVEFPQGVTVVGETETHYPLLAGGYEVIVRGLVEGKVNLNTFVAVTKASTLEETQKWATAATKSPITGSSSLCYQSYAHARVAQLVRLRDAANFLDDKIINSLVTLVDPSCNEKKFVKCIEKEAISLALDANIVAKGLTAMVTVDTDECLKVDDSAEVCYDGTTVDQRAWESTIEMDKSSSSFMSTCSLLVCLFSVVASVFVA